jgi:hypothetical protein
VLGAGSKRARKDALNSLVIECLAHEREDIP